VRQNTSLFDDGHIIIMTKSRQQVWSTIALLYSTSEGWPSNDIVVNTAEWVVF